MNPDILFPSHEKSRQANLLKVPRRGPYGEREIPAYRAFLYLSLYISLAYLSGSPVKETSHQAPSRSALGESIGHDSEITE